MSDETATTYTELAVALGRVEEGIISMKASLDRIEKRSEDHATAIARHETDIQVLMSRQQPRIHWLTILVGIVAVAAFALTLFDRLTTP
jgi:hypothetical protein